MGGGRGGGREHHPFFPSVSLTVRSAVSGQRGRAGTRFLISLEALTVSVVPVLEEMGDGTGGEGQERWGVAEELRRRKNGG